MAPSFSSKPKPKSTLRSSSRRNHVVLPDHDDSPTGVQSTAPASHLGKRRRNVSASANGPIKASKKQKAEIPTISRQKIPTRSLQPQKKSLPGTTSNLPARSSVPLLAPNSSRFTSAVQPPADGTIVPRDIKTVSQATSTNGDLLHPPTASVNGSTSGRDGDKRTLRSQDGGSRSKSELSLYFPNYEDLISNEPKETELLTAQTRLFISEESPKSPIATKTFIHPSPTKSSPTKQRRPSTPALKPPTSPTASQTIDFSSILTTIPQNDTDPLPAAMFHKAHRRAERQEKQLRNIEKERAQHEKVQLERILEGLKGHDWLRVMGISGITDGERKSWESKRAWCIREVSALLEKFRLWKEEERRRKVEKELSIRDEVSATTSVEPEVEVSEEEEDDEVESSHISTPTDVDRLAALQLHTEHLSASTPTASSSNSRSKSKPKPKASHNRNASTSAPTQASQPQPNSKIRTPRSADYVPPWYISLPPEAPPPEQPITSFFSKPHVRAAAMDQKHSHRRSGRSRWAFGQPLPELEEAEFKLPGGMVTDEARKSSARDRRQRRRSVKDK